MQCPANKTSGISNCKLSYLIVYMLHSRLSKAINRFQRPLIARILLFSKTFDICKYNVLPWIEEWYFGPCLVHKTRDKAQQTVDPESPRLINFPAKMNKFRACARNFRILMKHIDPNKLTRR
jgi:hypothetical protein